jgi:hypothetical protein
MGISNYPKGFAHGINVRGLPLLNTYAGRVYWVYNGTNLLVGQRGGSDQNKGTFDAPFSTLDYAVGQCIANRGDIIMVKAGHNENLAGADAVDVDVAGVSIIGLGNGTDVPTFDHDATASELVIGAANVLLENLRFRPGTNAVTNAINIEAAGDRYTIRNCRFADAEAATDEFADTIIVEAGADEGVIEDCWADAGAQAAVSFIELNGAVIGITIRRNTVIGDYSTACIRGDTTLSQKVVIEDNVLWNGDPLAGGLNTVAVISLLTGTIGVIQGNRCYTNVTDAVTAAIVADACFISGNTISTTAETPPVEAELLGRGRLEVTALATVEMNDEGEASVTFAINGPVDVYGIYGVVSTVANETEEMSLITESGITLMALGEIHTGTAVGDVFFPATVGAAPTVDEVGTAEQHVWSDPIRITGTEDLIDMLAEGDIDGGGACTLYVVWAPVVAGAEIQTT